MHTSAFFCYGGNVDFQMFLNANERVRVAIIMLRTGKTYAEAVDEVIRQRQNVG